MSSEVFAGIFVPLGLLILVIIAIYWLRVVRHKNNVNALAERLQAIRVEVQQQPQPTTTTAQPPPAAAPAETLVKTTSILKKKRHSMADNSMAHSLLPGLPSTLPAIVSQLFRQPSPMEEADPEVAAVLDRERDFYAEDAVERATRLIHRYVEREEASLLIQATWRFACLQQKATRLRNQSEDYAKEAEELYSQRDSARLWGSERSEEPPPGDIEGGGGGAAASASSSAEGAPAPAPPSRPRSVTGAIAALGDTAQSATNLLASIGPSVSDLITGGRERRSVGPGGLDLAELERRAAAKAAEARRFKSLAEAARVAAENARRRAEERLAEARRRRELKTEVISAPTATGEAAPPAVLTPPSKAASSMARVLEAAEEEENGTAVGSMLGAIGKALSGRLSFRASQPEAKEEEEEEEEATPDSHNSSPGEESLIGRASSRESGWYEDGAEERPSLMHMGSSVGIGIGIHLGDAPSVPVTPQAPAATTITATTTTIPGMQSVGGGGGGGLHPAVQRAREKRGGGLDATEEEDSVDKKWSQADRDASIESLE